MFITNFTQSVTRACIMGIILLSSNLFYQKQDSITSIAISILISLIFNPFNIYDIGFRLSYLGTTGIILFNKNIENLLLKKTNKKIAKILSVTISAQLVIMPISAYIFNNISLTFLISNFLASPILGIIMILGIVTIFVSFISFKIAKLLAIILNLFLELLNLIVDLCSKIPFSNLIIVTPYIISIIIIYIFELVFNYLYVIYNFKKKLRKIEKKLIKIINKKFFLKMILIIIISSTLFNLFYSILIPKNLKIYFIDVMQGDSTLIITPYNKKILIDGGEGENNTIVSYLLDRRIKKLDYIVISHFDSDHVRTEF